MAGSPADEPFVEALLEVMASHEGRSYDMSPLSRAARRAILAGEAVPLSPAIRAIRAAHHAVNVSFDVRFCSVMRIACACNA